MEQLKPKEQKLYDECLDIVNDDQASALFPETFKEAMATMAILENLAKLRKVSPVLAELITEATAIETHFMAKSEPAEMAAIQKLVKKTELKLTIGEAFIIRDMMLQLAEFAEYCLNQCSWYNEPDGGSIQDKAEELGFLELRPIDPEDSIDGETEHYFCKWTPKTPISVEI